MRRLTLPICFLALWTLPGISSAQEWTRFRGPHGSGECEATTIPVLWTVADCKWRVKLPGVGHSSPVVWGDRLFVTAGIQEAGTRIIRCLDTADGRMIWKRDFPAVTFKLNNSKAYDCSSPVVDEQNVYMMWGTPGEYVVLALTQARGEVVWRRDLGPFTGDHGFGASPIVVGELLIVANDQTGPSSLLALDRRTGETRWKTDRRTTKTAYSTPFLFQPEGCTPQLILSSTSHGVSSVDPATGKLNWELADLFGDQRVVGSPVACSGLIFASAGSGGGGKHMVAIKPADPAKAANAQIAYRLSGSLPYVPTSVAHGRLLFNFADSGVVTCLDAPTGEVLWRERIGGNYFGSPVRVGERIYCIARDGQMVVLAASDQFKLLGRINLEEPSNSTPAVADGMMYVRTVSHLMAVGGK
jgi:outer membrane protein assembly factor BamB